MAMPTSLARQIGKLTAREKAALADHLWREAEQKFKPTAGQLATLDRRAALAAGNPQQTRPLGDAVRQLSR